MKNEGAPRMRFQRHTESIGPMCHHIFYPWPVSRFPVGPAPGYRARRKEHALPIVRDEFRPAIPRRVARQHCPPPLHRHHQLKSIAVSNGIFYHRTVASVLTVCLSPGDHPSEVFEFYAFLSGCLHRLFEGRREHTFPPHPDLQDGARVALQRSPILRLAQP